MPPAQDEPKIPGASRDHEPSGNQVFRPELPCADAQERSPVRSALTGVGASFTALHTDPHLSEGTHEHTWHVIAWYPAAPFRDARSMKGALVTVLSAFEGKTLPAELWAAEDLALALMRLLGNCVGVDISRPPEGFYAQVRA